MKSHSQTSKKLNKASKSKKVKLEIVTKMLLDLNKQISEARKATMEPIPIDILSMGDPDHSFIDFSRGIIVRRKIRTLMNSISSLKPLGHKFRKISFYCYGPPNFLGTGRATNKITNLGAKGHSLLKKTKPGGLGIVTIIL
ncbi:hypothetical protein, partial [Cryptosporidium hominis TU502]|uniref:hypothetical protein n=1 Tax=Cryptosporidium hominis (strain TU502) TaxID=353151 RepID=UPI0000452AC9